MTVLALPTLGDVTKNRNDPISVVPPNVVKKGRHLSLLKAFSLSNVANVSEPKRSHDIQHNEAQQNATEQCGVSSSFTIGHCVHLVILHLHFENAVVLNVEAANFI